MDKSKKYLIRDVLLKYAKTWKLIMKLLLDI